MAIKPSPTIAGKLRKLFQNNKQTIEPAIDDTLPGGGGGGGIKLSFTEVETGVPQAVIDVAQAYYPESPDGYRYCLCNKTVAEILSAFNSGSAIWEVSADHSVTLIGGYYYNEEYGFYEMSSLSGSFLQLIFVGDAVWLFEMGFVGS